MDALNMPNLASLKNNRPNKKRIIDNCKQKDNLYTKIKENKCDALFFKYQKLQVFFFFFTVVRDSKQIRLQFINNNEYDVLLNCDQRHNSMGKGSISVQVLLDEYVNDNF